MFLQCTIPLNKQHICTSGAHDFFLLAGRVHDSTGFSLVTIGEVFQEYDPLKNFAILER